MLSSKDAEIENAGVPINARDDFSFGFGKGFRHKWPPSDVGHHIILQGCSRRQSGRSGSSPLKAAGKPRCTGVDAALSLDELIERLGMRLVPQCIPQSAGPFGPSAFINFFSI